MAPWPGRIRTRATARLRRPVVWQMGAALATACSSRSVRWVPGQRRAAHGTAPGRRRAAGARELQGLGGLGGVGMLGTR